MSRWTYKTEAVTVGGNTVDVRSLTYGERIAFGKASREARDGNGDRQQIIGTLLKFGCVNVSDQDIDEMPAELIEAATDKILELTGLKLGGGDAPTDPSEPIAGSPGEKKAP